MKIIWAPEAEQDLDHIELYIAECNPVAAYDLVFKIIDTTESILQTAPAAGRAGRVIGTRELIISNTPYIVPYRVTERFIEIIRVLHSARKWPESIEELQSIDSI